MSDVNSRPSLFRLTRPLPITRGEGNWGGGVAVRLTTLSPSFYQGLDKAYQNCSPKKYPSARLWHSSHSLEAMSLGGVEPVDITTIDQINK